jgi:hypothetical protein
MQAYESDDMNSKENQIFCRESMYQLLEEGMFTTLLLNLAMHGAASVMRHRSRRESCHLEQGHARMCVRKIGHGKRCRVRRKGRECGLIGEAHRRLLHVRQMSMRMAVVVAVAVAVVIGARQ